MVVGCSGNSDGLAIEPTPDASADVETAAEVHEVHTLRDAAREPAAYFDAQPDIGPSGSDTGPEAGPEAQPERHPDGIADKCGLAGMACSPSVQCAATVCTTGGAQECRVGVPQVVYTCVCCDGTWVCDVCN